MVFKALALGAQAVLIGRPVLYALAAGGVEDIVSVIRYFQEGLKHTMGLMGCRSIKEIHELQDSVYFSPVIETNQELKNPIYGQASAFAKSKNNTMARLTQIATQLEKHENERWQNRFFKPSLAMAGNVSEQVQNNNNSSENHPYASKQITMKSKL